MGFFSSIGKVLGKVGTVAGVLTGNPLIATAANVAGSLMSRNEARKAASTAWGRTMDASNTSYQRAVADMRAANLNPILAYSQGGASTPTAQAASTAGTDQLATFGSKGVANAQGIATVRNTNQQTNTAAANEGLLHAQTERERLNNEGLRTIPPHLRALAQMESHTGLGLATAGAIKRGAPAIANRFSKGVSNLKGHARNLSLPKFLKR